MVSYSYSRANVLCVCVCVCVCVCLCVFGSYTSSALREIHHSLSPRSRIPLSQGTISKASSTGHTHTQHNNNNNNNNNNKQGMVQGKTYRLRSSGHYLRPEEREGREEVGDEEVEESWEKMSKSKHNGVDPEVHMILYIYLAWLDCVCVVGCDKGVWSGHCQSVYAIQSSSRTGHAVGHERHKHIHCACYCACFVCV